MERKHLKSNSLALFFAIVFAATVSAKVIKTNTRIPLEVKHIISPLNANNTELLSSSNLLTKLGSNEIDPNVHPIENSNPPLADEPESPITNEIVPETPAVVTSSPEVVPDGSVDTAETNPVNTDDPNPINKFCKCAEYTCDCCRSFSIPILPVRAPTCARIRYLGNEKMSIQLKYGDVVLVTRTVSGSKSPPICIPMPGGYNQFCGRVYGLAKGPNDFKACLGFELRADDDVEATLRVSCFKFGSQGFSVAEAEPIPPQNQKDEEEDDDDDFFGLGGDDDEEEEDEEESAGDDDGGDLFEDDDDEEADDTEYPSEQESPDYEGFSVLDEIFSGGESKKLKGNATRVKTSNKASSVTDDSVDTKKFVKAIESPQTKDIMVDDDNTNDPENSKKNEDANEDGDDDDEDEEDDQEDDEDDDNDETDKTESNNKINKEKMSTLDYFLNFVEKLMKMF